MQNRGNVSYEAVIVLGFSIKSDGSLSAVAKKRVEKGAGVAEKHQVPVVLSGRWSFTRLRKPRLTEAQAMADYAGKLGFSGELILEEDSKDTIGNAYFTKVKIAEPKAWQSLVIVTTKFHIKRTKLAFSKVYGPNYNLEFIPAIYPNLTEAKRNRLARKEQALIKLGDKFSEGVEDGDDETIKELLFKHHPAYSRGLTWKKFKLAWFYIIYKFVGL